MREKHFLPAGWVWLAVFLFCLLAVAAPAQAYDGPIGSAQMLINKENLLEESYAGGDLVNVGDDMRAIGTVRLCRSVEEALVRMDAAMKQAGVDGLFASSGYRSYSTQSTLYQRKISYYRGLGYGTEDAAALAGQVVAPPGSSEHQSGMAIDVSAASGSLTEAFADTPQGQWLVEHCWEYGFILRYPEERTQDTGYIYEPWHFRYVGQPHAEYIHKQDLILEDYIHLLEERGSLPIYSSLDGRAYVVYFCGDLADVDGLPGERRSISYATAARETYIVTCQAQADALLDSLSLGDAKTRCHLEVLDLLTDYTGTICLGEVSGDKEAVARILQSKAAARWRSRPLGLLERPLLLATESDDFSPQEKKHRQQMARAISPVLAVLFDVGPSGLELGDLLAVSPVLGHGLQVLAEQGIFPKSLDPTRRLGSWEIQAMKERTLLYFYGEQPELLAAVVASAEPKSTLARESTPQRILRSIFFKVAE